LSAAVKASVRGTLMPTAAGWQAQLHITFRTAVAIYGRRPCVPFLVLLEGQHSNEFEDKVAHPFTNVL